MGTTKLFCAIAVASFVLPRPSFVSAIPNPHPQASSATVAKPRGDDIGSLEHQAGQVALQLPNVGLDGITPTSGGSLGIVANLTSGNTASSSDTTDVKTSTAILAQQLNLTSHWVAPFPPSPTIIGNNNIKAFDYIADKWQLWNNRLYGGEESNLHFIQDPYPSLVSPPSSSSGNDTNQREDDTTATVLQVDYQIGSYRQGGTNSTGGATFFPFPMELKTSSTSSSSSSSASSSPSNATVSRSKILLKYEIAFKEDFNFVKGGKLPGIFYGNNERDCSGGQLSGDGKCFSLRMMWRENGLGEVYAYLPSGNKLCPLPSTSLSNTTSTTSSTSSSNASSNSDVICNSDYGTSLGRGKFNFTRGAYTPIMMYVSLNTADNARDGIIQVWANNTLVVDLHDLLLSSSFGTSSSSSSSSSSGKMSEPVSENTMKIFFSTFFGGSTSEWASQQDTSTYFRNIEIYTDASSASASNDLTKNGHGNEQASTSHASPVNTVLHRYTALLILAGYILAIVAALYL